MTITTARTSHSSDLHSREVKYLVSMGVRTVCFVMAIITSGPLRWTLVAAAFLLPYFAVVVANAGSKGISSERPESVIDDKSQITSTSAESEHDAGPTDDDTGGT
ncbi:MAG: DUF3099 domain-containing protein [Nocardioidaceae bacterium]